MRKKILSVLMVTLLAVPMLTQCGVTNEKEKKPIVKENILEDYNEEGLNLLKLNFKTTEDMQLAVRNIGEKIGNLTFNTNLGKKVKLSSFKGQDVVISVVQSYCESCKKSEPIIHEVAKEKGVTVIPLFLNSTNESIDEFYKEIKLEKPEIILVDEEKIIKQELKITKTPTLIYIDKEGIVSFIRQEFQDEITLKDDMDLAFGETKIYKYKN